jgi:hypothetical protein
MSVRYDEPHEVAKVANTLIRWLAELGISVAGTRALSVCGRKTRTPDMVCVLGL